MPRRFQLAGSESEVHTMVCDYLRLRYPRVIFKSHQDDGRKRQMWEQQQVKRLNSSRAYPDLFLAEPSLYYSDEGSVETYHGLYLELKRQGVKIYRQDGELIADPHTREQAAMLERLRSRGYRAEFACGFDAARKIIDEYLGQPLDGAPVEF